MENILVVDLIKTLRDKGYHISCAESLTGGMLASAITSVSGASDIIEESYITYSERAKHDILGVGLDTIAEYNVVSEQVARAMVEGVARVSHAEICIAVTGVAGPTGGTDTIPVGTVCFGYYVCGEIHTETVHFGDIGRDNVRISTVYHALEQVQDYIK